MRIVVPVFLVAVTLAAAAQSNPSATADTKGEAAIVEQYLTRVHFENDGTGFREETRAVRIQSEAGIEQYGQLVFGYTSATEKLDVNYVRVRKPGGEVIETPAGNAQDFAPDVLQSAPMYSDYRERHVTVSGLRPGDILEYRTTIRTITPLATGEFWLEYDFPEGIAVRQAKLEVDVPKTREIKLKSPTHKYTMTDAGDRRTYTWIVDNLIPDRKDKDADAVYEDHDTPDVQLTTFKDWQSVAHWYAQLQGQEVIVDDSVRKKAAELTRGATTETEKARRLYDYVARNIRYVSLSFGIGRYQPHAANEVLKGSYGDCKDKHTLLSALLRAEGIESYPVLIHHARKLDQDVPSPAQFDHVITAARIDKQLVWLDATAEVAPFGLILYPLRDKDAVLASADASGGIIRTPDSTPVKNTLNYKIQGKVAENGALDASMEVTATGDSAVLMRIVFRGIAQADWPKVAESLARLYGYGSKVSDVDVQAVEEIAKPFILRYKVHQDSYFNVPGAGITYYAFPPLRFSRLRKKVRAGEPLKLGPALEEHSTAHIEFPPNFVLRIPPVVSITREYGEYSLSYHLTKNILDADRTLIVKVSKLPASRRSDVESLRSVATSYAEQSITCDAHSPSNSALASAASLTGTPEEMQNAAGKALKQRDFTTAAGLLKKVVEKQPDSSDAWDELGRAYAGLNNHPEAIVAYRKQVEINPFHKSAYDDLAFELERAGKLEDALAAYGKELANVPVDDTARKRHALLLAQLGHGKDALPELETTASAFPDDAELGLALARAYAASGNQEKSQAIMVNVIGSAAVPPNGDVFAAALREDVNADETLRNARKMADAIGEQFDSGAYDQDPSQAVSAMYFLALSWARIGWATVQKGAGIDGLRYLESAWNLSQSGTLANRLARLYEKGGDKVRARQMLEWAVAAGGADLEDSRARLAKLTPGRKGPTPASGANLLERLRTVTVPHLTGKKGEAEFILVFDGSSKPERAEFQQGDSDLASVGEALMAAEYPVTFPDYSSVKIVRTASVSCSTTGCKAILKPLDSSRITVLLQPQVAAK